MARFKFRLAKLLEYRQNREEQAKEDYLERQARRIAAETEIEKLKMRRAQVMVESAGSLDERINAERFIGRLTDELRSFEIALSILQGEEDAAKAAWLAAKSDSDALDKLREKDIEEWNLEEVRREQRDLDEWAVMRRAA